MTGLVERFLLSHPASDLFALGFLGTAIASTWPDQRPKSLDDWWIWVRDFVHQLGNAKRPTIQKP
jgi:hypothetical protein